MSRLHVLVRCIVAPETVAPGEMQKYMGPHEYVYLKSLSLAADYATGKHKEELTDVFYEEFVKWTMHKTRWMARVN